MPVTQHETRCDTCNKVLTNRQGQRMYSAVFDGGVYCEGCYEKVREQRQKRGVKLT